jgi:hypothetical protein
VAGDHTSVAQWEYGTTSDGIAYHKVYRQTQLLFSETNQQADWGYWYWSTQGVPGLTYQSGEDVVVRGAFMDNGTLPNTQDSQYRPINDEYPVFGYAIDLGSVVGPTDTLFTLGLTQEDAVQFDGDTGIVPVTSLWTSYFSSELAAVSLF